VEEEFRNGQEPAPILLHLEVDQTALSKTLDQQRKSKHATRKLVPSLVVTRTGLAGENAV